MVTLHIVMLFVGSGLAAFGLRRLGGWPAVVTFMGLYFIALSFKY